MAIQMKTAFLLLCVGVTLAADPPSVTVPGMTTFIGTTTTSRGGRTIQQFFAIPYAEAPINTTRFLAPVKKNWTDEDPNFDASRPGYVCTQFVLDAQGRLLPIAQDINMDFLAGLIENENCLTLDIHVPMITDEKKDLPVLFYIHGGSFVGGTSQSMAPHYFLDEDIILVAPQYRLGPLGFLKLNGNADIVGNAALLDQLEALKWVHENIAAFGGDPGKVTLAGNSAGAVCAGLLHISPLTNNTLFQQVIQISGSVTSPFAIDLNAGVKGTRFASDANCPDEKEVVDCLQKASIEALKAANQKNVILDLLSGGNGMPNTLPSIQEQGENKVIDDTAVNMLGKKGDALLPTITGVTRHEGMYPIQIVETYLNFFNLSEINGSCIICNSTAFVLPLILGTDNTLLIDSIQETYFPDEPYDSYNDMYPSFVDFIGALYFKAPAYDMALRLLNSVAPAKATVYLYSFDHQDNFNTFGVGHAGDMVYLFPNGTNLTSAETEVSKKVVQLYASFVINGKPTAANESAQWPAFTLDNPVFMEMNTEFKVKSDFEGTYTVSRREGMKKPSGAGSHALPSLLMICLFNFLARLLK